MSRTGGAAGGGGLARAYRDAEDAATIPEGNDLQVSANDSNYTSVLVNAVSTCGQW